MNNMESNFSPLASRLIRRQLKAGIEQLEREAADRYHNITHIQVLGLTAKALGHPDVCERALRLFQSAPSESFFAGILTNLKLPKAPPHWMRTIGSVEKWQGDYPLYQGETMIAYLKKSASGSDEHLALCLEGRFAEARALAGSGRQLEEVGSTLAVLGEFEIAGSVACDPALEAFRQKGVRLVLVMELFRRKRTEEATDLLGELEAEGLSAWDRILLATAFADRVPWIGYPYPDW